MWSGGTCLDEKRFLLSVSIFGFLCYLFQIECNHKVWKSSVVQRQFVTHMF